ncbi:MAG: radical SAM protein [Clostridiales bacterium]|jgi:MoaA/NifB/PqqE/SkfB family radical SAM enzyme|nr:radical SAM protein [Clostridiales bacterium]
MDEREKLLNIAGYPVLTKNICGGIAVLAFIHESGLFRTLVLDQSKSVHNELIKKWGFHAPNRIPSFMPPFRSAALTITSRCNMDCPYCFVYPIPRKLDISESFAKTAVKALAEHMTKGRRQIYLWGGEPTQNPKGLFSALNAVSHDECAVTLTTNGCAEDEMLIRLARYDFLEFQISFDGVAQDRQKRIAGGSYNRVMHSVHLLNAAGKRPILRITVTTENIGNLRDMFKRIIEMNLTDRICIEPVHAYAGRSRLQQPSQPDPNHYVEELFHCIRYAEQHGRAVYSQPLRPLTSSKAYDWGFINILPDGNAVSTVSIIDSSHPDAGVFQCGRIVDGKLEISENAARQSSAFIGAVARKCVMCPVFSICKGNEQRDYFASGTPAAEYRCEVFRAIMKTWMSCMMEKALPMMLRAGGESSFTLKRKAGEQAVILNVSLQEEGAYAKIKNGG